MKVQVIYRNDPERELYDPLPEKPGVIFRVMKGDLVWGAFGGWLKPPYKRLIVRWLDFPIPLPFFAWRTGWRVKPVSWRLWRSDSWDYWTGYVGAKVAVFDRNLYPQYTRILPLCDLRAGSMAMQPSIRPGASPE